jgi:RimJ/RimL family protein N-acetyltransferase
MIKGDVEMITTNLFQGEKVRLTALEKEDAKEIATWYDNASFARLLSSLPARPQTEAQIAQWIDEENKGTDNYLFGIRTIDEKSLVGYIELERVDLSNGNAWLAIAISPNYWRKGYGVEAFHMVLHYAFSELCLHRIQLTVFSYNTNAIQLYEKVGFIHEGTYREYIQRDGERHDMHLYGLLKNEWNE